MMKSLALILNLTMFKGVTNKKVQKKKQILFLYSKKNRAILRNLHFERLKFTYLKISMQLMGLVMLQFDLLATGLELIGKGLG
jgi:hypothetical protein